MLSDEEIGFYREFGYLVVEGVFDQAQVAGRSFGRGDTQPGRRRTTSIPRPYSAWTRATKSVRGSVVT